MMLLIVITELIMDGVDRVDDGDMDVALLMIAMVVIAPLMTMMVMIDMALLMTAMVVMADLMMMMAMMMVMMRGWQHCPELLAQMLGAALMA